MDSSVDYLIIGGGIAGVAAAEAIREQDKSSRVSIIASEPHLLYSRVLLPSYLKQKIKREQVFMRSIDDFDKLDIHFYAGEEVVEVRPTAHDVVLHSGNTVRYRKLLIAAGGQARSLPFDSAAGILDIHRLQTLDDADRLYQALPEIHEAVVIGGGFIALEFLEILRLRGIQATLLCEGSHFADNLFSPAGSALLEANFAEHETRVFCSETIESIKGEAGKIRGVVTSAGKQISCDALCVGIGIERNLKFLDGSGIVTGKKGILTDSYLRTSEADIYAAGDIAEFEDAVLDITHSVGNWNNAFLQGKTVGKTLAGAKTQFQNLSSYSISNLGFHMTSLGHIDRNLPSVIRYDSASTRYMEIFLKEGAVIGASLINLPNAQSLIQRWIREKQNFAGRETELADTQKILGSFG
ncbi:MAG: hypothetical protein A3C11_00950 [Candidatus Sungbacteria bacterium RIFCSPHIGHO2_02_FULL_49_12]|uniref:FAD/NAD(P)-binding domain-containing protein n=1 Tax=Candidatus Sungbacteria bacterium RIFCSPHIGHO2_02_FULL_49_12 TaxID=1802271 RepID=A0A1G2KNN4_9BACT|nr:MAG: hypothetical protein A3C11_00950 [Candidatus Sungbacteria bacterium RIFCSPHIGHO2_02_FULL_49_12]